MKMHFVNTGNKFPYAYYIGVKSASLVGDVKLWLTEEPNSVYFDKLNYIEKEFVKVPDFPALKNRDPHFNRVSTFDYVAWKVLASEGGSILGLDSITLKEFQSLLLDKEMLVGRDAEDGIDADDSYCMHGATCIKGSEIAQQIHEDSIKALNGEEITGRHKAYNEHGLRFGGAGIIPFLNNVYKNPSNVQVAPFGILGGYLHNGNPFYLYEKDMTLLNPQCCTIPFYATWQSKKFDAITEDTIKGTLLGKLVEELKL